MTLIVSLPSLSIWCDIEASRFVCALYHDALISLERSKAFECTAGDINSSIELCLPRNIGSVFFHHPMCCRPDIQVLDTGAYNSPRSDPLFSIGRLAVPWHQ